MIHIVTLFIILASEFYNSLLLSQLYIVTNKSAAIFDLIGQKTLFRLRNVYIEAYKLEKLIIRKLK